MIALETATRVIVDLLRRKEYAVIEALTHGQRLSANDLARAIGDYGRTLVPPGDEWWSLVEVTPLSGTHGTYYVAAPLWTAEEGRSDLTLELLLEELPAGQVTTQVLDVHVL